MTGQGAGPCRAAPFPAAASDSSPLPVDRKIYIHINNTNPILLEDAPERRTLEQHGMEVAVDRLELQA